MTAVDAPLSADAGFHDAEPPAAPAPVPLTRTTPRYTTRPVDGGKRIKGICQERGCDFQTASFTSAGFLSGIFAAHGLVLSDDPTDSIPACPSVLRVES